MMTKAVSEYKARRDDRLAERGAKPCKVERDKAADRAAIEAYTARRAQRVADRQPASKPKGAKLSKFPAALLEKNGGVTRTDGMTVKDAWAALVKKGITPEDVYRACRRRTKTEVRSSGQNKD